MSNAIQFKVNSVARSFDGDPETPLLWYLRDTLDLTGTKFGCGVCDRRFDQSVCLDWRWTSLLTRSAGAFPNPATCRKCSPSLSFVGNPKVVFGH